MERMIWESKVFVAFDQSGVAGALFSRGPRGERLLARAFAPLAEGALVASAADDNLVRPEEVRQALAQVHRELGGNGRPAALVLPDGIARLALLDPPAGVAAQEFARFRLAQGLPYAASEALIDGLPAPPAGFVAAAVRRSVVRAYEAAAAAAGLRQQRVDLYPLLALAALLREPAATGNALAVLLSDAAFTLAAFDAGRLRVLRNRRRDNGSLRRSYPRLRDEILRTASLAGAHVSRVVALGADSGELAAWLRAEGLDAAAKPAPGALQAPSAWLEAALA